MDNITLDTLIQRVIEITDEKVCEGQWKVALRKAEKLWDEIDGFDFCKTESDYECRFWWAMLAYRYAHLLMNDKNDTEIVGKADKLFEAVYSVNQEQGGMSYLGTYAGIYRLATLFRLRMLDPQKYDLEDKIATLWNKLGDVTESNNLKRSTTVEDRPLHFHYRNMFELASYFIGKSSHSFAGRDTFCGLPFSGYSNTNGYRLVFSDRVNKMILYPIKIARQIALGYKNAIVYQIDSNPPQNGKWLSKNNLNSSPILSVPPAHTLRMLTWLLYNPDDRLLPTGEYARRIKSLLREELQKFADCEEPFTTNHGQGVKLTDYPLTVIGIVHDSIFASLYDSIPKSKR